MNFKMSTLSIVAGVALLSSAIAQSPDSSSNLKWQPLFTQEGKVTSGWKAYLTDQKLTPLDSIDKQAFWEVRDKILYGTGRLNTPYHTTDSWLLSEREYSNFVLETEFRFRGNGEYGDSGIALRVPLKGVPSYEGIELQMVDEQYERNFYPNSTHADALTGALYLLSAPRKMLYRPNEWNRYRIDVRGPKIKVWLNGEQIQDVDLSTMTAPGRRHRAGGEDFLLAKSGAQRPLKGHIGFQDDSDKGEVIMFRNTRIAELN